MIFQKLLIIIYFIIKRIFKSFNVIFLSTCYKCGIFLFSLHQFLMRFIPSTPTIERPLYWNVLASPKKTTQSTPLACVLIGRAICANEMM